MPSYYEFFAGGGMARAGLGPEWRCLFANDFDPKKVHAYRVNWGGSEIHLGDIRLVNSRELPDYADLIWASFPCQDLSLAGNGAGLSGERSATFWEVWRIVNGLRAEGRAPRLLVVENVVGALTSNGGRDFQEICGALHYLGYVYGALTIDAVHFIPQSRPRLFIVAVRKDQSILGELCRDDPLDLWASDTLKRAHANLREDVKKDWRWWVLPNPAGSNIRFADLVEAEPKDVSWHSPEETGRFLSMMTAQNRSKVERAKKTGRREVGTIYRRTRKTDDGGKIQRAEIRFDDVAGCLRTPSGGSSRQFIMVVENNLVRTRLLSGREAARLMGLPDEYKLPQNYNEAYHLMGDGLAVPVVRHLARTLLLPLTLNGSQFLAAAE
jgi:DNA (cytosine-5)-methyltransferase 1